MHSGSSLKSNTFLHNYGREIPKREGDKFIFFFPLSSFCLGWATQFKDVLGTFGASE